MTFGTRRSSHHVWDDVLDTLGDYGDRAHDLFNDGLPRTAGYLDHGRDRAEDVYDRSRRRAAGATDAFAGRRSGDTAPILIAAAVGVLAGAALTAGLRWWLQQRRNQPTVPVEHAPEAIDDPLSDDAP